MLPTSHQFVDLGGVVVGIKGDGAGSAGSGAVGLPLSPLSGRYVTEPIDWDEGRCLSSLLILS